MYDDESTAEVMRGVLLRILAGTFVSGPGLVRSASGSRIEVVPMINRVDADGEPKPYTPIPDVLVLQLGGAGWEINIAPSTGDIVWLFFADSSLDEWKSRTEVVTPQATRSHAITDAVALPLNLGSGTGGSLTVKNTAGTVSAEFESTGITLEGLVTVNAAPGVTFMVNTHTHIAAGVATSPPTPGT